MSLLTLAQAKVYLGIPADDQSEDAVLQLLVDQVVALLARQCGRTATPWGDAQAGRVEVCDGTGTDVLWLPYPVATLTQVVLGQHAASPGEALAGSDPAVLHWQAGSSRIVRVDGGRFAAYGQRAAVRVTYDTQADCPADGQLAVERVVAAIYGQRGSEDASTERVGGIHAELARVAESDPTWQMAVANLRQRDL